MTHLDFYIRWTCTSKLQNVQNAYIVEKVTQRDTFPQLHGDRAIDRDPPTHH